MNLTRLDVSLEQYEVGLSGAVPDRKDWSEPAMDRGRHFPQVPNAHRNPDV
jgi:hypothetical protein